MLHLNLREKLFYVVSPTFKRNQKLTCFKEARYSFSCPFSWSKCSGMQLCDDYGLLASFYNTIFQMLNVQTHSRYEMSPPTTRAKCRNSMSEVSRWFWGSYQTWFLPIICIIKPWNIHCVNFLIKFWSPVIICFNNFRNRNLLKRSMVNTV